VKMLVQNVKFFGIKGHFVTPKLKTESSLQVVFIFSRRLCTELVNSDLDKLLAAFHEMKIYMQFNVF